MAFPRATTFLIILFSLLSNLSLLRASSSSSSSSSSHSHHNSDFLECLTDQFEYSNSATDVIFTSTNATFTSLLQSQNLRPQSTSPLRPSLIVTPFHESEIQATVFCSKKLGMQIKVRSGGHDYEGLSYTSQTPFVILDMRNFRSISVSVESKTAWVGAGATLGQLYHTIARKSKTLAFTAGICPTVGVGGHFAGGGYGMMSRKNAIAADHIVDARLIDANGRILDRESMGEDLFWAIRGGGGTSFGIVVAYKINLITVPETVTVFNVTRTSERLVDRWQHVADKMERNLSLTVFLRSVMRNGNRTIVASFISLYLGRADELLAVMRREFPELGIVERDCVEMRWIQSTLFFAGVQNLTNLNALLSRAPGPPTRFGVSHFKGKSDYVTTKQLIPVSGLRGIWRFLHEEDENSGELQFSAYGGALSEISETEIPFPYRAGTRFIIHYGVFWERGGNAERERHLDWIRRLYSYMTPYVSQNPRGAYVNYRDLDIGANSNEGNTSVTRARVWGRRYFKNNFERLVRVKTEVDPSNFFRNEQSIPPML